MKPPFYRCAACRHDFTVTAGTLFGDTRRPLTLWFEAMWYVVNPKHAASALGGAAGAGRQLPDRSALVAQAAPGDGATTPRPTDGTGGGGRGVISAGNVRVSPDEAPQARRWCWLWRRPMVPKSAASGWGASPRPRQRD